MNDTHPEVAAQFQSLMRLKSNEERLLMGCSMYDAAKQIVEGAILNQNPGITPQRMKKEIFLRFYGMEFRKAEKEKIFQKISS